MPCRDAGRVRDIDRLGRGNRHVEEQRQNRPRRSGCCSVSPVSSATTRNARLADIVKGANTRMLQLRHRAGLPLETDAGGGRAEETRAPYTRAGMTPSPQHNGGYSVILRHIADNHFIARLQTALDFDQIH